MEKQSRKEPRYVLPGLKVEGEVRLSQTPDGLPFAINDISLTGASITFGGQIAAETDGNLVSMVKASKNGNFIPVQMVLAGVRIPVNLVNMVTSKKFGLCISSNEKLAVLADRGKIIFSDLVKDVISNHGKDAPYEAHIIPSREFLPEDVREFVESSVFGTLFMSALADELPSAVPMLKDKVESVAEYMKLADLCRRFLETTGKDVALIAGAEMVKLREESQEPYDDLLPVAIKKICGEGRLFATESERVAFESILVNRYFKNRPTEGSGEVPAKHPYVSLIKTRFDGFNHEHGFYITLAPYLAEYYFFTFIPRNSEMIPALGGGNDKRLLKNTIVRWIHNILNQINADKDKTVANDVETRFKNAMYHYMMYKKHTTIILADVERIIDGKGITPAMDFRAKLFSALCGIIDAEVQKKFAEYKAEQKKEEKSNMDPEDRETQRVLKMVPLDIVKEFLWPEIMKKGLGTQLNKEVARTFVPKEKDITIAEFGGMIVFDQRGFDEFLKKFPGQINVGNTPDYFDKIDFKSLYDKTVDTAIGPKKDWFGLLVDGFKPNILKERTINDVVNSPDAGRYYILKKPKSFFAKTFAEGTGWLEFIEKNMLTSNPGEGFV